MLADQHGNRFTVIRKPAYGARFVLRHEAGIPDHIRAQNRGELAFDGVGGHAPLLLQPGLAEAVEVAVKEG
jgi:hypothetical protein